MNYPKWNNIISEYFFNESNAGKDIFLYLTRQDVINLGKKLISGKSNEEIWLDYINAIRNGNEAGSNESTKIFSPIERPLELYNSWNKTDTPPFIAYLCLYIIPLTENYDNLYNANNYYGKINLFFYRYKIIDIHNIPQIKSAKFKLLSKLWNSLEDWTIIEKDCDLGIFELKKFGNPKWIHVGKPFSQCVLPPSAIKKLPELFFEAGLVPNSKYSKIEFKNILLKIGSKILLLNDSVLDLIRKSDSHELGQSIIEIVIREYNKWKGETHEEESDGVILRIKRNYTVVQLLLQFTVHDDAIAFSYRIYSLNDYPSDLRFGEYENLYEINGWSKTLTLEFKEPFELKDEFNKWVARFPERDIRLFVNAGIYQLSNNYWIETDSISKIDSMRLLCRNNVRESILEWGKTFSSGNFREEFLDGIPKGYAFFSFNNPLQSHPSINSLILYSEKKIELVNGLKVNFRTFINDFLPEVEIKNTDGKERVYLQYKFNNDKIFLEKKKQKADCWVIPDSIILNTAFHIKVENENLSGNEIAYNIISSDQSAVKIDSISLPKRDSFGNQIKFNKAQYLLGNNVIKPPKTSQRYFCSLSGLFTSIKGDQCDEINQPVYFNHVGNKFSAFLSLKGTLTTEEFYTAFEFYISKAFIDKIKKSDCNLTIIKKAAINFFDYTGYIDYDYETKKIIINPPQLIFIPTSKGRKVLLIGARDSMFINTLITESSKNNLQVGIKKQFPANELFLLPDVITIKSFGDQKNCYGENILIALARKLNIQISDDYFPQHALLEYSENIEKYEESLMQTEEDDYGWARKIFNPNNLKYEKSHASQFDKSFSLIEYKLNEYTFHNKLWKDGICFKVDKNWGKYLALKRLNENVILIDNKKDRVAIPVETPLPRLLAKSIMLLSGFAPDFISIKGKNYRVYENIPGVFAQNLFLKLGQKPKNECL